MKTLKISSFILLIVLAFSCQKEYSFEQVLTPAGTWEFNDSTKLYTGNIDTAYIETTGTTKTMTLMGKSADGLQTFRLHLYAIDSFTVGTYKASLFQTDFEYYTQAKTIYKADGFIGEFIVTVTALANNSITGIFSGASTDSTGANKPLTLGKFTSRVNLFGNGTGGGGAASGILVSSAGVCSPFSPSGIYTQGVTLNSTNTLQVQLNVTTPGTYTISTNTVNGVTFSKSGTFTITGVQNVILDGTGTPVNSGNQNFTVTFGTSTCNFSINFGVGVPPATGTLGGSPGACAPITPAGTYTQGVALTAANTVTIQANVATVGAYTISTNTVNGVSFTNSGTFTTTGVQNVVLTGTGTPTSAGIQNFTVTFGTSTCTFPITFAAGTPPPTGDYFPTTVGSNWAYGNTTPADSFKITVSPVTKPIGAQVYNVFLYEAIPPSTTPDSLFFRKSAGDYFENINTQTFFGLDGPGSPPNVEYIFLKDNVPQGTTWQSSNFSGQQGGTTYTIFIRMTLFEKATTPTTSGVVTSSDVLKVRYEYFITVAPGTPFFTEERWFARGIGMIYQSFNFGTSTDIYRIGRYIVN